MNDDSPRSLPRTFSIDLPEGRRELDIYTREGFEVLANLWTRSSWENRLSYEVTWLGFPIIQMPEDLLLMQELIHKVRPDVLIETGTAHGGSAIFYASLFELLGKGRVISIDVEIRKYNSLAIQSDPMSKRIQLVESGSTEPATLEKVRSLVRPSETVMVCLDSKHTCDHVLDELRLYAPFVTPNSYLVVFDGVMELLTDAPRGNPEWATDNPQQAVRQFLAETPEFVEDAYYQRLKVTHCQGGFLKRLSGAPE